MPDAEIGVPHCFRVHLETQLFVLMSFRSYVWYTGLRMALSLSNLRIKYITIHVIFKPSVLTRELASLENP